MIKEKKKENRKEVQIWRYFLETGRKQILETYSYFTGKGVKRNRPQMESLLQSPCHQTKA